MIQTVTAKVSLQLLQRQVITATAAHSAAMLHEEGHEERSGALHHAEDRSNSSAARHGAEDGHGTATVRVDWATEVVTGRVMRRRRREAAIISRVAPLRGQTAPVQIGAEEEAPDGPMRLCWGSSSDIIRRRGQRQSPQRKQASQTQSVRCIKGK